jgi:hypothetical protein
MWGNNLLFTSQFVQMLSCETDGLRAREIELVSMDEFRDLDLQLVKQAAVSLDAGVVNRLQVLWSVPHDARRCEAAVLVKMLARTKSSAFGPLECRPFCLV